MHFSASSTVGLGLLAAQVTAIVVNFNPFRGAATGSTKVLLPVTFTITTTATAVPLTTSISTTISANATISANSTASFVTSIVISAAPSAPPSAPPSPPSSAPPSAASSNDSPAPTSPPTSGLTADQQRALDLHNTYRAEVGCENLVWDAELTKSAQAWADRLALLGRMQHDPNPGGQGENLASMSGGTNTFYANAAQMWLNEKSLYNGKPIAASGSPSYHDYGHYTQCVWKSTKKVGIALAKDLSGTTYVVARYLPPGNYVNEMPY